MLWLHIVLGVTISRDPLLQKTYSPNAMHTICLGQLGRIKMLQPKVLSFVVYIFDHFHFMPMGWIYYTTETFNNSEAF